MAWRTRSSEPGSGRINLDEMQAAETTQENFGFDATTSPGLMTFASTDFVSDRDRSALMLVGSSGGIVVQVNDRTVLDQTAIAARPYAPDSDLVRVSLKKGNNRIMVRTRQGVGSWCFGVQISDPSSLTIASGSPGVEGLRAFALTHPGDVRNGEALFFEAKGVGCATLPCGRW